jgi:hypothetical protein
MGLHLSTKPWYVENQTNFSHAAPIYALPAYDSPLTGLIASSPTRTTAKRQVTRLGFLGALHRRVVKRRGGKRRRGGTRRYGYRRAPKSVRHRRAHRRHRANH